MKSIRNGKGLVKEKANPKDKLYQRTHRKRVRQKTTPQPITKVLPS
jgi:hypothetical protein